MGSPSNSRSLCQLIREEGKNGLELVQFLYEVLRSSEPTNLRIQAANMILDRGWGQPTTEIDIAITARPLAQYTTEELDQMLLAMPDDEEADGQLAAPMGDTLPEPGVGFSAVPPGEGGVVSYPPEHQVGRTLHDTGRRCHGNFHSFKFQYAWLTAKPT